MAFGIAIFLIIFGAAVAVLGAFVVPALWPRRRREQPAGAAETRAGSDVRVMGQQRRFVIAWIVLAVILSPLFFIIYRMMIFNTLPRDDYAPYVLWLLHAPGGVLPGSPYVYRILSVALAAALDHVIPLIHFSKLPSATSLSYEKATEAVATLSYLSIVGAIVAAFGAAQRFYRTGPFEAAVAAAVACVSMFYSGFWAIDPPAILAVFAGVLLLESRWSFVAFIAAASFFNEKILIVFAGVFAIRAVLLPGYLRTHVVQISATLLAIAVYLGTVHVLAVPGNSYQLTPSAFPATVARNVRFLFSTKGAYLDDLPYLLMLGLWWAATRAGGAYKGIARCDGLVILFLLAVSLVFTKDYSFGRIVMYASPLFWVPAAPALARWIVGRPANESVGAG